MNSKYKINLIFVIVLITIFPIISSTPSTEHNEDEKVDSIKKHHSSIKNNRTKDVNSGSSSISQPVEEKPEQLFAHYRESYITKEAAKEFRQRVRSHKKPYSDTDYDDLIQEIEFKPKHKKASSDIYDKKYFDYLPAELNNDEQFENDEETIKEHHKKGKHSKKRSHGHRSRRDVSQLAETSENVQQDKEVAKRQTSFYPSQHLIDNERGQAVGSYPVYKTKIGLGQGYYYPVPSNNPWSNKFYSLSRPYISNHYLPVPVSPNYMYVAPPFQPFELYPTPNVYYNPAFPPVNPPPKGQVVTEKPMTVDNRFNFEDEEKFVWEVIDNRNPNLIKVVGAPTRAPPTRRTPPSIIRGGDDVTDAPPTTTTQRVRTRRPAPPIIREVEVSTAPPPPSTTRAAPAYNNQIAPELGPAYEPQAPIKSQSNTDSGPTRCVWGIVNCCRRGNPALRYNCFEMLGCGGAFWDYNPCSDNIFDAAVQETNRYFD
jgi:hypothetical protein